MTVRNRGSLTIESAIVLPVILLVIFTMGFLIQIFYVHTLIQHAITETAKELATHGHLLYVSGVYEEGEGISYEQLVAGGDELHTEITQLQGVGETFFAQPSWRTFLEFAGSYVEALAMVYKNPEHLRLFAVDMLRHHIVDDNIRNIVGNTEGDELANSIGEYVIEGMIRKYLVAGAPTMENRLAQLNIVGGLDFDGSEFFASSRPDHIKIVVSYTLKPILPIPFFTELLLSQQVTVRGWVP